MPEALLLMTGVGALILVLILASLSTGAAVLLKNLPRQRPASANTVWVLCSGGKIVNFDPAALEKQLRADLGEPTVSSASDWAGKYSSRAFETGQLQVSGQAKAAVDKDFFQSSAHLDVSVLVRRKPDQGEDQAAVQTPGSDFQKLLAEKDKSEDFFFFFVDPDSIESYRVARNLAAKAGFGVEWTPIGHGEPARIAMSGNGREANMQ
jgi:hypothetical protein